MIKIGITSCIMYPNLERTYFPPKHLCYLERDTARYVTRPNVLPILIPDLEEPALTDLLAQMDGFVFQGGSDMAPDTYGEQPIGRWQGDAYRDAYEMGILDYAIRHEKPVFGICRGFQLMNVYFGGTLYQDIVTQLPDALEHRDATLYDQLNHEISLTPSKLLDRLHRHETVRSVNSVHHQAVKDLGQCLDVLATSPADGLIEAFQWTQAPEGKVLAVQWHPEFSWNSKTPLIEPNSIYELFLQHCSAL